MGTDAMGRVTVAAKIENWGDLYMLGKGLIQPDQVHRIEVSEASVDMRVIRLSIPGSLIRRLNLVPSSSGAVRRGRVYGSVRLTIQERECTIDVAEVPEDSPVIIGRAPVQLLDFVVDRLTHSLIGNPAHGGEQMIEMY